MSNDKQYASMFTSPLRGCDVPLGEDVGLNEGVVIVGEGRGGVGHFPGLLIPHSVHILSVWMLSSLVRSGASNKPALIAQHSPL